MRRSTKNLEDTITASILIVQDAVRVFQCLDLSLSALHAFFIAHARISDASRKKLLQLLRVRDGPLEVTQDHLHHPNDPCRRALGSGVRSVEASVGSIILDRGLLLNETLFDGRLRSLAVEVAQNLKRLLDGAHAFFRFSNGLLVLFLLLSTSFRLVGVVRVERRDLLLQLRFLQSKLLLTCIQLLKTGMQCLDIAQTVIAILHRRGDRFVAPALVISLVGLLLQQLL